MAIDHEHDDDYDDEPHQLVASAASEHGPTTYTQHDWISPHSTDEAQQKPDVVTYGEAGIHHDQEWTEGRVTKVVRPEEHDEDTEASYASTKGHRPERRR